MIRWLWSMLMKWGWDFNRGLREDDVKLQRLSRGRDSIVLIDDEPSGINLPDPILFKVQAVTGGTLVETRWYDQKKDENCNYGTATKIIILLHKNNT